jgi:hypothetical protein
MMFSMFCYGFTADKEHSEAMDRFLWDLGAAWKSAGDSVTDASLRRNRLISERVEAGGRALRGVI